MLTRRKFIGSAGVAATGLMSRQSTILKAVPKATTELGKVKIQDVKTAVINIRYPTTLVKVTTNSGLFGLGEAYPKTNIVSQIEEMKRRIIGKDPLQVE